MTIKRSRLPPGLLLQVFLVVVLSVPVAAEVSRLLY